MATHYKVQLGNEEIEFEGPDGLTDEQIVDLTNKHLVTAKPGTVIHQAIVQHSDVPVPAMHGQEDSSGLGAFLRGTPKDALFNFDDEIASFANAHVPGLAELDNLTGASHDQQYGNYEGNLAATRDQAAADQELHPTANVAGRIGGVLATLPKAGAKAVAALPRYARLAFEGATEAHPIKTAITLGTAGGAVSGAGAGEEGTRAKSAALGALTGAAVGGSVAGASELAPAIARYARVMLNRAPQEEAVGQIVTALRRDGFDLSRPADIQTLRDTISQFSGKPVSLADVGRAIRSRAGVGLRAPSDAQAASIDTVLNRQAGQGARLSQDIRNNVAPRTDVHALDDALQAQRAQDAEHLREQALFHDGPAPAGPQTQVLPTGQTGEAENAGLLRQMGLEVPGVQPTYSRVPVPANPAAPTTQRVSRLVDDQQLKALAETPMGKRSLDAALKQSQDDIALRAAQGLPFHDLPDVRRGGPLDMRTLDAMKRHMDQQIGQLYRGNPGTFQISELQQLRSLRDALRGRMREVVPEYGNYLDQYSGSSDMLEALAEGQNFRQLDPEQIIAQQGKRSQAAQELYRVGAARDMTNAVRGTEGNAATKIPMDDIGKDQVRALGLTPENAAQFERAIGQERQLSQLPRELQGSDTQARQAAAADADAGTHLRVPFNPAAPVSWLGALARGVLNKTSVNRNASVNEALLPRILETNPEAMNTILDELAASAGQRSKIILKRNKRVRRGAGVGGIMIGGPVALPNPEDQ